MAETLAGKIKSMKRLTFDIARFGSSLRTIFHAPAEASISLKAASTSQRTQRLRGQAPTTRHVSGIPSVRLQLTEVLFEVGEYVYILVLCSFEGPPCQQLQREKPQRSPAFLPYPYTEAQLQVKCLSLSDRVFCFVTHLCSAFATST